MQSTSELYKELLEAGARCETRLAIGNMSADDGYGESVLISLTTKKRVFSEDTPSVGDCVAGEIEIEMHKPSADIPRRARLIPYIRLTDGIRFSEWIQKGVFYIDTRENTKDGTTIEKIKFHGYDDMLKAEQDYPTSSLSWPAKDLDVVQEIAAFMGVPVDSRTLEQINHGYLVQYPGEYSCRETLGYIAGMYGGCFIMSDVGALRLVSLNSIPPETRYLITSGGEPITFGGVRILV